jgi:hypothetical protein
MLDSSGGVVDNYVRLTNRATCTVQISPLKCFKIFGSSSAVRSSSKPLLPAQETILTERASLWKTTTKPPFMSLWTLHVSDEVLNFSDAYCLFAILLGQPGRLGDAIPLSCTPPSNHCMLDPSGGAVDNYVRLTNRATCTVQISPSNVSKVCEALK